MVLTETETTTYQSIRNHYAWHFAPISGAMGWDGNRLQQFAVLLPLALFRAATLALSKWYHTDPTS